MHFRESYRRTNRAVGKNTFFRGFPFTVGNNDIVMAIFQHRFHPPLEHEKKKKKSRQQRNSCSSINKTETVRPKLYRRHPPPLSAPASLTRNLFDNQSSHFVLIPPSFIANPQSPALRALSNAFFARSSHVPMKTRGKL